MKTSVTRLLPGPMGAAAIVLLLMILALHWQVFVEGDLITPAGMHHAMWPWKAEAAGPAAGTGRLEGNYTLSDLLFQFYPWQLYTTRTLALGSIPLWNPYSYAGVPFVANAQSAVFFPLHWPAFVFPSLRVFTVAILLKMLLAGLFMMVFLRGLGMGGIASLAGAVSFALCGYMTSWLGYSHTNAAIFLPLLMHAARMLARSPGVTGFLILIFAGGAQYLGGHPDTSLHMMCAALLYFLWNLRASPRPVASTAYLAGGGLMGFFLAAVQMFPFIEYLLGSAALQMRRTHGAPDAALPGDAFLALLVPGRYGDTWDFTYNAPVAYQAIAGYAGAGVLLLALMSIRWMKGVRFFQLLLAGCAVIVYGPPEVRSMLQYIPLLSISSGNRLLLLLDFCLAVLAAHVIHRMMVSPRDVPRGWLLSVLGPLALAAGALVPAAYFSGGVDPQGTRLAAAVTGGTALLFALAAIRPSRRSLFLGAVVAILCVDMVAFAYGFNPHADPAALFPPTPLTDFLRRDAASDMIRGGRIMTVGWVMRPETQMVYRLSSIEGYDAMEYPAYQRMTARAGVDEIHLGGLIPDESRPLLDLLGLRYVVTPPQAVVSGEEMRLAYDGPDGRVFINERAGPRFRFVADATTYREQDGDDPLDLVASGRFDPAAQVLLEAGAAGPGPAGDPAAPPALTVERNRPQEIRIRVGDHAQPGYLVVADSYAPGWEATVDGHPVEVLRANYGFRAVPLPRGEASVRLVYRPLSFRMGVWLSILTLLCALAVGLATAGQAAGRRASPAA